MKYITVINRITGSSVPFSFSDTGEIILRPAHVTDIEDFCFVISGNIFYEFSLDINKTYTKI